MNDNQVIPSHNHFDALGYDWCMESGNFWFKRGQFWTELCNFEFAQRCFREAQLRFESAVRVSRCE